jgi:hypothetical protein
MIASVALQNHQLFGSTMHHTFPSAAESNAKGGSERRVLPELDQLLLINTLES